MRISHTTMLNLSGFTALLLICCLCSCNTKAPSGEAASNPLLRAPNQVIDFAGLTPENITAAAEQAIARAKVDAEAIKNRPAHSFENTLLAYDRIYNALSRQIMPLDLIIEVEPRLEVREASAKAQAMLKTFKYELEIDEGLFKAINSFAATDEGGSLTGYKKKFLDDLLLQYRRSGFELSAEKRREIKALKSRIDDLGTRFSNNIAAASGDHIVISPEQTEGLDSGYLEARRMDDGNYKIDVSYPSLIPFMRYATNDSLRKALMLVDDNRAAPENIALLDSVLYLRHQIATILGYNSYSEYELSENMAKSPAAVWDFENSLIETVKEKADYDRKKLLNVKSAYTGKPAEKIEMWEFSFYSNIMKNKEFRLDERKVKEYFEQDAVLHGLFTITQQLLGLKYEEVSSPSVWHPDVRMFNCYDAASGKLIGRFYLDMYPREHKYSHAAMFSITGGMALEGGGYEMPEASLVCNFPKPEGGKPSLMSHGDVETFFHEFGHLLHAMVTKAPLAYQSGPDAVVIDFVEAPSQIYENWAWNKQTLELFAKHYKTGKVIPDSLLDRMLAVKNVNSGIGAQAQLFYGSYALTLHDRYLPYGEENTTEIAHRLITQIEGETFPEASHFEASFGHLIDYSGAYYSYLWSKVYAQDMWSVFESEGPLNPKVGKRYRELILEPGDSRDALEMVKDFLGREPNNKALLKDLGLDVR